MKPFNGEYIRTAYFGQSYAESVLVAFPQLRKAPWYGKSLANEYAPRPIGSIGEVVCPVPVKVVKVWTRTSDKALVVDCAVNIANHPLQGKTFQVWHLGEVAVKAGQWIGVGQLLGYVGGKYGFTGAGTGAHIGITLKVGGKYYSPQLLINWQPPKPAPKPAPKPPVEAPRPPVEPVLPPEPVEVPPEEEIVKEEEEPKVVSDLNKLQEYWNNLPKLVKVALYMVLAYGITEAIPALESLKVDSKLVGFGINLLLVALVQAKKWLDVREGDK